MSRRSKSKTVMLPAASPGNPMYKPKKKPTHGSGKSTTGYLVDMHLRKTR